MIQGYLNILHYVNGHQTGPMLLGDGADLLSKWILKPYVFNPTFSAEEKNLNKNLSSTTVTVERVFGILKVRCRGLLTILVANREINSNAIIKCFTLSNFCLDLG